MKEYLKKSPEELQEYLHFKRRGFKVPPKKGKGSYSRSEEVGKCRGHSGNIRSGEGIFGE